LATDIPGRKPLSFHFHLYCASCYWSHRLLLDQGARGWVPGDPVRAATLQAAGALQAEQANTGRRRKEATGVVGTRENPCLLSRGFRVHWTCICLWSEVGVEICFSHVDIQLNQHLLQTGWLSRPLRQQQPEVRRLCGGGVCLDSRLVFWSVLFFLFFLCTWALNSGLHAG
jgi:hypothetical protein